MATKISTILDQLKDVTLPALFPNKTEIPNAYSLIDNNDRLLKDAWGIRVNTGGTADYNTFNTTAVRQEISIVLSREVVRLEHDNDPLHDATKLILEDALILRKDFLHISEIDIEGSIEKIDWNQNTGIEFVSGDNFNFIFTEVIFSFEISEDL